MSGREVPTRRAARIRVLRGAAGLLDSAIDNGDEWAFCGADGEPLSAAEAVRVRAEIESLVGALLDRAERLGRAG